MENVNEQVFHVQKREQNVEPRIDLHPFETMNNKAFQGLNETVH